MKKRRRLAAALSVSARQNPQYYEVVEGLQPGEKVIISGYDLFGENERLILR